MSCVIVVFLLREEGVMDTEGINSLPGLPVHPVKCVISETYRVSPKISTYFDSC